jgi:hypothetical protein
VITLQDPHNFDNREILSFNYIKTGEDTQAAKVAQMHNKNNIKMTTEDTQAAKVAQMQVTDELCVFSLELITTIKLTTNYRWRRCK